MQEDSRINGISGHSHRLRQLWGAAIVWAAVMVIAGLFFWILGDLDVSSGHVYLILWIIVTGVVVVSPSAYLLYRGKFDLFHPLVFAAWSYVFPAFVIGGIIIWLDMANPYVMLHVVDPAYNIPYSLALVSIGFIGLTVGYALPVGGFIARKIEKVLPDWQWSPSRLWWPGLLLMFIGIGVNLVGVINGIMGFQKAEEVGIWDSTLNFLLTVLTVGNVLLWLTVFSTRERRPIYYAVLTILVLFIPLRMALLGSRSSLMLSLIPIVLAYLYAGRKLTLKKSVLLAVVGAVAVFIGVAYGTSFRNIKGSEARVEAGEYAAQVGATIDYLTSEDPSVLLSNTVQAFCDRIENLSSLAVVASNYERLAPFEADYGLENNILNDAITSLVPRFVWPDKPNMSNARAYSDLYFDYGDNSFAISPFGDLLRNYGPYGVPIGMFIVGLYLRVIYSSLIDTPATAIWKKAAYFPLLTVVSYEAFYAIIFPNLIRTIAVLAVSLLIVNLLLKRIRAA